MRYTTVVGVFLLTVAALTGGSETASAASVSKTKVSIKEVDEVSLRVDGVVLNNLVVSKKKSLSGKEYVDFSASLRNKNKENRDAAVFVVCRSTSGALVCCASLKPTLDTIRKESTETIRGDYYIDEGDFSKIATVDIRLVVR